ncbi:hypothetical protein [Streptomyces aureocirculatus]|uniref:hypothetical protein n=1 Tax=Streptomyces aureocirculatus TaxID=67275 RepID=UPI0004CC696F|nr:hypothetical protein [Streptomyces aureocirculatus]
MQRYTAVGQPWVEPKAEVEHGCVRLDGVGDELAALDHAGQSMGVVRHQGFSRLVVRDHRDTAAGEHVLPGEEDGADERSLADSAGTDEPDVEDDIVPAHAAPFPSP